MGIAFRDAVVGGLAPRLLAWAGPGLLGMAPSPGEVQAGLGDGQGWLPRRQA